MTLTMPTPESLEAEATELEAQATKKEDLAARWPDYPGTPLLLKDAGYFRSEAAAKRAKAARMRGTTETHTASGTSFETINRMEADDLARWQRYLKEIGSTPWGSQSSCPSA